MCPLTNSVYIDDEVTMQTILLAEDDANDVCFLSRMFQKCGILNNLQVVENGEEANNYLKGEGRYSNRTLYPLPVLMLLDMKMPKYSGLDVLRWLQTQPKPSFPILMLTTFQDLKSMNEAYSMGASTFLVKPIREEDFLPLIKGFQGIGLKA